MEFLREDAKRQEKTDKIFMAMMQTFILGVFSTYAAAAF